MADFYTSGVKVGGAGSDTTAVHRNPATSESGLINITGKVFSAGGSEGDSQNQSFTPLHQANVTAATVIPDNGGSAVSPIDIPITAGVTGYIALPFQAVGTSIGEVLLWVDLLQGVGGFGQGSALHGLFYNDAQIVPPYGPTSPGAAHNTAGGTNNLCLNDIYTSKMNQGSLNFGPVTLGLTVGNLVAGRWYWLVLDNVDPGSGANGNIEIQSSPGAVGNNQPALSSSALGGPWAGTGLIARLSIAGQTPVALKGISENGHGVEGNSTNSTGVYGFSKNSNGMIGISGQSAGVVGISTTDIGVQGNSASSSGVYGFSASGIGVQGVNTQSGGVLAPGLVGVEGCVGATGRAGVVGLGAGGVLPGVTNYGTWGSSDAGAGGGFASNTGTGLTAISTSGRAATFAVGSTGQANIRLITGALVDGPPAGSPLEGDMFLDLHGHLYLCTSQGWQQVRLEGVNTSPNMTAPTAAASAGSGSTGISLATGSTNERGAVLFTGGAAPVSGSQVTVTFAPTATTPLAVVLCYMSTAGIAVAVPVLAAVNVSAAGFDIFMGPAGPSAGAGYRIGYIVYW